MATDFWANYRKWNELISERYLRPEFANRPVYLDVDDTDLSEIREAQGWEQGDDQADFLVVVANTLKMSLELHGDLLEILEMDAHRLAFRDHQFDAVMCLHTMDFVQDSVAVTLEIFRVLKKGGDFIITYPTGRGSSGLAGEIRRSIAGNLRRGRLLSATAEVIATLGASVAYAPLALSNSRRKHALSQSSIERLMESLAVKEFTITEDPAYQDLVVLGKR